jgi:hypothetical protein
MNLADHLTSPLLSGEGFRHCFFTRAGGVSEGPYSSLNFSASVGDEPLRVVENLKRAAGLLEVEPEALCFLAQVHGAQVRTACWGDTWSKLCEVEGDALVSSCPELACGVRTADCVPVLLGHRSTGEVAAVHAGWRGVVRGVVGAAVLRFASLPGGAEELVAAIGPHISVEAFEVSGEVAEELARAVPGCSVVAHNYGERPHVDLRRAVRAQLESLGVGASRIDDVVGCTMGDPRRFFSFRRDGPKSGRHLSAIVPR